MSIFRILYLLIPITGWPGTRYHRFNYSSYLSAGWMCSFRPSRADLSYVHYFDTVVRSPWLPTILNKIAPVIRNLCNDRFEIPPLYLTKWYHLLRNTEKLLLYTFSFFTFQLNTSYFFSRFFLHRVKISQNLRFQTIRKYLSSYPRIKGAISCSPIDGYQVSSLSRKKPVFSFPPLQRVIFTAAANPPRTQFLALICI